MGRPGLLPACTMRRHSRLTMRNTCTPPAPRPHCSQVFASHAQFKDWFSNPLTGMVEGSAEVSGLAGSVGGAAGGGSDACSEHVALAPQPCCLHATPQMNRAIVERLHAVLRPFLLRRLKKDVEKQLPGEARARDVLQVLRAPAFHPPQGRCALGSTAAAQGQRGVTGAAEARALLRAARTTHCCDTRATGYAHRGRRSTSSLCRRLSKRQRKLYEEYMASGNTRATLASGNFLGIMNCLMQLRKVGGRRALAKHACARSTTPFASSERPPFQRWSKRWPCVFSKSRTVSHAQGGCRGAGGVCVHKSCRAAVRAWCVRSCACWSARVRTAARRHTQARALPCSPWTGIYFLSYQRGKRIPQHTCTQRCTLFRPPALYSTLESRTTEA